MDKNYDGLLMIFRSVSDGKTWILPYNLLRSHYYGSDLTITTSSNTKLDWNEFEVLDTNISSVLVSYYKSMTFSNLLTPLIYEQAQTPITINQQKEAYTRKRFTDFSASIGLDIQLPPIENAIYDLLINKYRIQEKPARFRSDCRIGLKVKLDHGANYRPYEYGLFDFLLIHIP